MANSKITIPNTGLNIVECGVFAPAEIPAINYYYTEIQLTKSYDRTKHTIVATPLSNSNVAWVYVTVKWVNDSKFSAFITNMYQQESQNCGFSWCIVRYA